MSPPSSSLTAVAILAAATAVVSASAFVVVTDRVIRPLSAVRVPAAVSRPLSPRLTRLFAEDGVTGDEAEAVVADDAEIDDLMTEITDQYEDGHVEEEEEDEAAAVVAQEDPETVELKSRIVKLESDLKKKRGELNDVERAADRYTEGGYVRKVAEIDQIRKLRGLAFKSNEYTARSNILTKFLPSIDTLSELDEQYSQDEFASAYSALGNTVRAGFTSLGAIKFEPIVGEKIDVNRLNAVTSVYSEDVERGSVVAAVVSEGGGIVSGWELEGNVMRRAECVESLGSEREEVEAEATPEEAVDGGDDVAV